jgi:phosphoribosyl 1,2-cyclic phosphodiesterase
MRVVLGGVRGTAPVSHPDFSHFGGATTCVLVADRTGHRIVLDAGTGLQSLAPDFENRQGRTAPLLLLTHYHLDHLMGLPGFPLLYDADAEIIIAAPLREGIGAQTAVERLIAAPFWPVGFRARQRYLVLPQVSGDKPFRYGPFEVRWCAVHHHNGCHAYRIDEPDSGRSLVFATDLEWAASNAAERQSLLALCRSPRPLDLLIMDGQFDSATGARFRGWGHSTWQEAVEVARAAAARHLVVTHHAPDAHDGLLAQREQALQVAAGLAGLPQACLAREGMTISLEEAV